jgi:hypothetical protein
MTKPMIKIVNAETGDELEREMNAAEMKQFEKDKADFAIAIAAVEAKAQAKSALLVRLGITEDEAKLLLS